MPATLRYFLYWLPMLIIAVVNGTARDLWYKKYMDNLAAHQFSTFTLVILLGLYIWFILGKVPPANARQAIYIGIYWALLTLLFECCFGWIRGYTLSAILADYNISKGRTWILVPLWLSIFPYICKFFKNKRSQGKSYGNL